MGLNRVQVPWMPFGTNAANKELSPVWSCRSPALRVSWVRNCFCRSEDVLSEHRSYKWLMKGHKADGVLFVLSSYFLLIFITFSLCHYHFITFTTLSLLGGKGTGLLLLFGQTRHPLLGRPSKWQRKAA